LRQGAHEAPRRSNVEKSHVGVARFSDTYEAPTARNAARVTAHLTNYTLNKAAPNFEHVDDPADGTRGSKRCMSVVLDHMHRTGLLDRNELWADLKQLLANCTVAMAAAMRGAWLLASATLLRPSPWRGFDEGFLNKQVTLGSL
jgi:hypothetical protein